MKEPNVSERSVLDLESEVNQRPRFNIHWEGGAGGGYYYQFYVENKADPAQLPTLSLKIHGDYHFSGGHINQYVYEFCSPTFLG